MPELEKIERPTTIRSYSIWLRPAEGEDWGTMHTYGMRDEPFEPNKLCVIVRQSHREIYAGWSQVREEHDYGPPGKPYLVCRGTLDSERYPSRYDLPLWWLKALEFAERTVRELEEVSGG